MTEVAILTSIGDSYYQTTVLSCN